MGSKTGKLIREARVAADLTQEKLAKRVGGGLTASELSRAERGETNLTNAQLKKIAVATGVTQASLLGAAKEESGKTATKKSTAQKSTAKKAADKKPKTPANANTTMRVTATEKKLVEAYRLADASTRKAATRVLKGECSDMIATLLGAASSGAADSVADMIGDMIGELLTKK